jgi:hypothetical protein
MRFSLVMVPRPFTGTWKGWKISVLGYRSLKKYMWFGAKDNCLKPRASYSSRQFEQARFSHRTGEALENQKSIAIK